MHWVTEIRGKWAKEEEKRGEKQLRNFAKLKRKKREGRRETNSKIRREKLGIR